MANTAAYVTPPSGGPSCRLPTAASSPVTDEIAGKGSDRAPGAGRLLAGSIESPELASSLALRLPACWLAGRWEALGPPSGAVLRLRLLPGSFGARCRQWRTRESFCEDERLLDMWGVPTPFLNIYFMIFYSSFSPQRVTSRNNNDSNNWITLGIKTSCRHKRE